MLQGQLFCNLTEEELPGEEVRREYHAQGTASAMAQRMGNKLGEYRNWKEGHVAGFKGVRENVISWG